MDEYKPLEVRYDKWLACKVLEPPGTRRTITNPVEAHGVVYTTYLMVVCTQDEGTH